MCFIFFWLTLVVGLWVSISAWVLGNASLVMLSLLTVGGISAIALSAVNIRLHQQLMALPKGSSTAKPKFSAWHTGANVETHEAAGKMAIIKRMRWSLVAAGIFLIVVGTSYAPSVVGWNSLGAGIAVTLLSGLVTQISPQSVTLNLFNRDGSVLLEVSQVEWEGGSIIIKGKVLGSLSTSAYFKAEEVWKALGLISPPVIMHFPLFLYRGWRSSRRKVK